MFEKRLSIHTGSTSKSHIKRGTGISFAEQSPQRDKQIPIQKIESSDFLNGNGYTSNIIGSIPSKLVTEVGDDFPDLLQLLTVVSSYCVSGHQAG